MPKYELTSNFKMIAGRKLFQIKALISFGDVEAGDLGGYIETVNNLVQEGDAWVYGNARVSGNAEVYGNARVYGDAWVSGNADWLLIGRIGSRAAFTTFFKCRNKLIRVSCGCFYGTIAEFRAKVATTHGNNKHAQMYNLAADMAELQMKEE